MPKPSVKPPSKLRVGSVLIYPSKDLSSHGEQARAFIRYKVKQDQVITVGGKRRGAIEYVASVVAARLKGSELEEILGKGGCLIPVPRHGLMSRGTLWPSLRICNELRRVGIGDDVLGCLERTQPVKQSSTAAPRERPGVKQHYESLRVNSLLVASERIVLIDDVVTRGATLIACGQRILEKFPRTDLVAFAFGRVDWESRLETASKMFSPLVETIEYDEHFDFLRRA